MSVSCSGCFCHCPESRSIAPLSYSKWMLKKEKNAFPYHFSTDGRAQQITVECRGLIDIRDGNGDMVQTTELPQGRGLKKKGVRWSDESPPLSKYSNGSMMTCIPWEWHWRGCAWEGPGLAGPGMSG